jgi:hypothetical protein
MIHYSLEQIEIVLMTLDGVLLLKDNICRLIINVRPWLKLIKDLLSIALASSSAIANTFVGRSASFCQANVFVLK